MKKVLLSIILALLCQVTANATTPNNCHPEGPSVTSACIKTINGTMYIAVTFWCMDAGYQPWIWYDNGSGMSGAQGYDMMTVNTSGYPTYYYLIDPTYPLREGRCVDYVWAVSNNGPAYPPGAVPAQICPCSPCDARFTYCVKEGASPGTWDVTFNMLGSNGSNILRLSIDGSVTGLPFDPAYPIQLTEGSYQVCIDVLDSKLEVECTFCANFCFGDGVKKGAKPGAQGRVANLDATVAKIYPNPTSGVSRMEFKLVTEEHITIELIDLNGRVLNTIKDEKVDKGYHVVNINTSDVSSGTYIVRLKTGNTVTNYRLSVIK